jgi:hypothetical protein
VAHLAESLDRQVVAEHVETPEVLEWLRTTGIECGQGFLFDPALPAGELLSRHPGRGRAFGEPPPRPHLLLLEPYLLLPMFLKGADILHAQLLEVLVHATREPSVLRDTQRFFASLRDLMARGYLEKAVPEARDAAFAYVDGLLAGVDRHLDADELGPGVAPLAPAGGADACPAARALVATGAGVSHAGLHGDAESLAFFLSRAEYAAADPPRRPATGVQISPNLSLPGPGQGTSVEG